MPGLTSLDDGVTVRSVAASGVEVNIVKH